MDDDGDDDDEDDDSAPLTFPIELGNEVKQLHFEHFLK